MKDIQIKYEEVTGKYYVYIDGALVGKQYNMFDAIISVLKEWHREGK